MAMKVGILTYHRAFNYGAYLQSCALCGKLNEISGVEAEIIDFQMVREKKHYELKRLPLKRKVLKLYRGSYFFEKKLERCFKKALNDPVMVKSKESLVSDSIEDFTAFVDGKYDVIVAGSDEIWKVDNFRGFPTPYLLGGDLHCKKMSYAASARIDFRKVLSESDYIRLKKELSDFDFISVRDQLTYDEVTEAIGEGADVAICCDPSFLYKFDTTNVHVLERLRSEKGFRTDRKTIMVMIDDTKAAKKIRESLSDYNLISVYKPHKGYINVAVLSPIEWVALIDSADYVIASYFHAICFSIVSNTPFIAVGTRNKKSKLLELLNGTKLSENYRETEDLSNINELIGSSIGRSADYSEFVEEKRKTFNVFLRHLSE